MTRTSLFAVPVMVVMLSGCVLDNLRTGPAPQTAAATPKAEEPAEIAALSEPARPARAAKPQPPIPEPAVNPSVVIGMAAGELRDLLGPPEFRRRDKPAEIWRYTNGTCVLDVFLYEAAGGGPLGATHFEFRSLDKEPVVAETCFTNMLGARKEMKSG